MWRILMAVVIAAYSVCSSGNAQEKEYPQEQDGIDLALERLLADKGRVKVEIGMTYNASTSDRTTGAFATIRTGTGTFVSVPVGLGTSRREAEILIGTTTVRYGLTARSELFVSGSAIYAHTRTTDGMTGLTTTADSARFYNVVTGVNYQLLEEGKHPGLIGFADVTLSENVASTGSEFVFAKSGTVGFTAYRVIDPVVLSLTGRYRPAFSRDVSGTRVDPGDVLILSPVLAFAVNNELTLIGGLSARFEGADEVGGVTRGARRTRADMGFRLAYAWSQNVTLLMDARTGVIGEEGLTVGMRLSRKFYGY